MLTLFLSHFLQLFESILLTLPRQTGGGGKSPAEVIDELSADILSKFPPPFDMEMVMEKYPVIYEESMNTVLRQELIRFNRLTTVVRKTLQNLQKAIKVVYLVSVHNNNRFIWQKNRSVSRQRRVQYKYPNKVKLQQNPDYSARPLVVI